MGVVLFENLSLLVEGGGLGLGNKLHLVKDWLVGLSLAFYFSALVARGNINIINVLLNIKIIIINK